MSGHRDVRQRLAVGRVAHQPEDRARLIPGIVRTQHAVRRRRTRRRQGDDRRAAGRNVHDHRRCREPGRIEDGMIKRQCVAAGRHGRKLKASVGIRAGRAVGAFDPDLGALERRRADQAVVDDPAHAAGAGAALGDCMCSAGQTPAHEEGKPDGAAN